jgi:hypothetical protein
MRKLGILTTAAALAFVGGASAQDAPVATTSAPAVTPAAAASGSLEEALNAYAIFHSDVSDLRSIRINTADDLETALNTAARHNRDGVTRGYGAMTAAQSPAFVQGVRDAAAYYGRDAVIRAIEADQYYAQGLRGAPEASRLVLEAANADGARVISVADRYQEMAYGLQRLRWANAVAPQQAQRVQRVRALGAPGGAVLTLAADISPRLAVTPGSFSPSSDPTAFGGRRFWDTVRGGADIVQVSSQPATPLKVNDTRGEALYRMTSIAALEALNATEDHSSAISQLMNDPRSRDCLEMAQLQLYQCMSAARFRYENAFCLGEHGLRNVGACISTLALPDTAAMTPISSPVLPSPSLN